jgi:ABC-type transport system involved in multi-copper enzyme maturation permease subunit
MASAVGLTAAGGIARERQKQTLIDLLMIPDPRSYILRAKTIGALARGFWPMLFLIVLMILTLAGLGVSFASVLLLVPAAICFTIFALGLGAWLSVRCRNIVQANAAWMGTVATIVIGTFLLAEVTSETRRIGNQPVSEYQGWTYLANPALSWYHLSFSGSDLKQKYFYTSEAGVTRPVTHTDVLWAVGSPVVFCLLGLILYWLAARKFDKEGRI